MDGIVAVQEDRKTLEQLNNWKVESLKKIEQNVNREVVIDKSVDIVKNIVKVGGSVATVVMMVCPFEGPAGEIATVLGSTALVNAVEASRDLLKSVLVDKDPEKISAAYARMSSECQKVEIHDRDMVSNIETIALAKDEIQESKVM